MKWGYLMAGAVAIYLALGSLSVWFLHDRAPLILIMLLNYALCAAIFTPVLAMIPPRKRRPR